MIARRGVAHGSGRGKVRWVVERAFAWLHQFKRLRIRYERRADLHQGLLELACSLICLRRLRTAGWRGRSGQDDRIGECGDVPVGMADLDANERRVVRGGVPLHRARPVTG